MITYAMDSNEKGVAVVFYDHSGRRVFRSLHKHMLLAMPFSLIITDMFDKEALTPRTEMLTHSKGDIPAVLAVRIVDAFVNEQNKNITMDLDRQMKIPVDLLLKAITYQHIRGNLTPGDLDNLIYEMKDMINPKETKYVLPAVQNICIEINGFMEGVMIRMEFPMRVKLCAELLKVYHIVGKRASEERVVSFHPEVLS